MSDKIQTISTEKHIDALETELLLMINGLSLGKIKQKACELVKTSALYDYGYTAEDMHKVLIAKGFNFKKDLEEAERAGDYLRDYVSYSGEY